ncbi:MAG: hypothetical protein WAU91_22185 [Desulfatitalea sp.]
MPKPPIFSAKHLIFILTFAPALRLYIISFFENYSMCAPSVGVKKTRCDLLRHCMHETFNELMCPDSNNMRNRFVFTGFPETGSTGLWELGTHCSPRHPLHCSSLSANNQAYGDAIAEGIWVNAGLSPSGRTAPKLKVISHFADMGSNKALAVFYCIFLPIALTHEFHG